jgi:glycosyltransferase involved in cell wall biosynthesis
MNQIYYEPQVKTIAERVNKPARLVQCIQAHNEEEFIGLTLASIYNEVDRILVIEGAVQNRPNSTPDGHSTDRTREIIEDFKTNHDPDKKVVLISIKKHWKNLEEMKQTFLDMSIPGDWLIINDADEFYRPEDIARLRRAIDLQPYASEFIVNFLHFYKDFFHVAVPGPEWNCQHQRIIKYVRGMKYIAHPTVYDPAGHDTYFSPHYQNRRFVPVQPINIYHYGYARNGMDQIMKQKQEYYEKELAAHAGANKKFDQKIKDWFANTEPVLEFDGQHPAIMQSHPMFGCHATSLLNSNGKWQDDPYYKLAFNGEVGNIWLCQQKLAQPHMSFYHNGLNI